MAATSERAATADEGDLGIGRRDLADAWRFRVAERHHGVQNHSTAGFPTRLAPLNGAPDSVVPVNCSRSSATAAGGLTRANARAAATAPSTSDLVRRENRVLIRQLLRSSRIAWTTCVSTLARHDATTVEVQVQKETSAALRRCQFCRGPSSATKPIDEVIDVRVMGGPDHEFGQTRRHICSELTVQLRPVGRDEVGGLASGLRRLTAATKPSGISPC